MSGPRVVALGGGHGLYASLTALRGACEGLTAVVTVADDGGSSGRIRAEMPVPPPGDLRMALSALCEDTEWGRTWRDVLQWRFATGGPLDGHAVGNLLIAGLWDRTGGIVEGLDWVARLLRAEGRVLPVSTEPITVSAEVACVDGPRRVFGQVAVATAPGRVTSLAIEPPDPAVPAATLDAIALADAVILGPGSWYTSVLTHFLVPRVAEALVAVGPRTILTLNIADEDEETAGTNRVDDIAALRATAPEFRPAAVLVDAAEDDAALRSAVEAWGARYVCAPMREEGTLDRHDVARLRDEYQALVAWVMSGGALAR
ncbi:gluconeogenesis factor YvcK family protein [Demequina gelatinilytica]|uniref:gluconeogenesis factor YvcK family protein n=1 Tax=Demequina gelatinilytica TaxID=1638980 RepID=UPI0007815291|nr:uridine diphosphate-N-acetylglucosamine-binding protein YvcK [Demequina gelatinilytica]